MTDETYTRLDDAYDPGMFWEKHGKFYFTHRDHATGETVTKEFQLQREPGADPFYPLVSASLILAQVARADRIDFHEWACLAGDAPDLADAIARGMGMTRDEVRHAIGKGGVRGRDLYRALSVSPWAPVRTPAQIRRAMLGHIASLVFNAVTAGIVLRLVFPGMPIIMIVSAIVASLGLIWIAVGLFEKRKGGQ